MASEEKKKRNPTSVKLLPELHKRALHYKVETGKDLQDIVNEALAEYLKKRGA